ncbi:MAG: apolipoprotein N-acyltransferase [Agromyces sp.]
MVTTRPLPWGVALGLIICSGVLLRWSFPEPGIWAAAPAGIMLWLLAVRGRGFWGSAWLSLIGSLAFWLSLIQWLTLYLGPLPWAALATLMSLYMALAGAVIGWLQRWVPRIWPGRLGRLVLLPALIASVWLAREQWAATWPYGGFSWGRIAMGQTTGPFAELLSWIGANGVSWVMVAFSAALLAVLNEPRSLLDRRPRSLPILVLASITVGLAAVPVWSLPVVGQLRVLAVQGGADASLFTDLPAGSILRAQANATVERRDETADVIVWPENGADLDPLRSGASAAVLSAISDHFNAPIVVGAITYRDEQYFNSSLLWRSPSGLIDWYDKAHPVPFAEYMPDRAFWRPFAPDLIDLISRDYAAGTRPNVLDIGRARAGIAICFDIAYDDLTAAMVREEAGIIFAQTNNADFGHTDENVQQLEIARMRAIETGRAVINISTVGTSAILMPDGHTLAQLETWSPGSMLENVPLVAGPTQAALVRAPLNIGLVGFGILGTALTGVLAWGGRRYSSELPLRRVRSQSRRS